MHVLLRNLYVSPKLSKLLAKSYLQYFLIFLLTFLEYVHMTSFLPDIGNVCLLSFFSSYHASISILLISSKNLIWISLIFLFCFLALYFIHSSP